MILNFVTISLSDACHYAPVYLLRSLTDLIDYHSPYCGFQAIVFFLLFICAHNE
jgi:hypothetical protein